MKKFSQLVSSLCLLMIAQCMPKDYDKMLESIYNHSVPLLKASDLASSLESNEPIILLDTRSMEEFRTSHIKGARLIEYDRWTGKDFGGIPKDTHIVVYCSVGYRSERIGEKLMEKGYNNVKNLYGGIFQWKNEGYEVVNEKSMKTDSVHTYNKRWSKWLKNGVKVY